MNSPIHIIGAGLAGSEAAYQLARQGHDVALHEMRPVRSTAAHKTSNFAELVCSNTFKSKNPVSGPGMLKWELEELGSLILECGVKAAVPGGDALAVDRDIFSAHVTEKIKSNPRIRVVYEEVISPPEGAVCLIATGPLTSPGLGKWLQLATGTQDLYFYDAIAPIVDASTIDFSKIYLANRYDKGEEAAYLNCPMSREEYEQFVHALLTGEKVAPKPFEEEKFFQGCQPIEAIAASGVESLRFGPMKPVGLRDPRTGKIPHAVIQLRPENHSRSAYNLVGFQTKLKYPEQSRIFKMIPGLENASFFRMGSIHRNTYVCGPRVLRPDLSLKSQPRTYLAGQITGVEGYLESTACGLLASRFIHQRVCALPHVPPPATTALGALLRHVVGGDPENYQPSGMHFGLFEPMLFDNITGLKRDLARTQMSVQARTDCAKWIHSTIL